MVTLFVRAASSECTTTALLVDKSWGTSDAWLLRRLRSHWSYHADTITWAVSRYIRITAS
ncbi:hypothetical protein GW17_00042416 [Ensete ventricosum]|nr:hypothetical protein GW17_00042416 [Ensete ventricosum]